MNQTAHQDSRGSGFLSLLGNILWFVLAGFWLGISYILAGLIMCITIIGIPFGIQAFKLAGFSFWPFGKAVISTGDPSAGKGCLNVLWFVFAGIWLALEHIFFGLVLCITIIGIPFGVQSFKLAQLALWPFGSTAVRIADIPHGVQPTIEVKQLG